MKKVPPVDKDLHIWKIIGLLFFGLVLLAALWECQLQGANPCDRLITKKIDVRSGSLPDNEVKVNEIRNTEDSSLETTPSFNQ